MHTRSRKNVLEFVDGGSRLSSDTFDCRVLAPVMHSRSSLKNLEFWEKTFVHEPCLFPHRVCFPTVFVSRKTFSSRNEVSKNVDIPKGTKKGTKPESFSVF